MGVGDLRPSAGGRLAWALRRYLSRLEPNRTVKPRGIVQHDIFVRKSPGRSKPATPAFEGLEAVVLGRYYRTCPSVFSLVEDRLIMLA